MLDLIVNGSKQKLEDHEAFHAVLVSIEQADDLEIWVSNDDGASLCALLNRRCGWLMFLRSTEDTGFSSRNPAIGILDEGTETFILANGQADEYPKSWTLDRATIFAAILSFSETGDMPLAILWHEDSDF